MTAPASIPSAGPVVLSLAEWHTREFTGVPTLTPDDRALLAQVNDSGRLQIDELRQCLRVRAFAWVGVVRFSGCEIHVRPKLSGDNLGLVELLDYAHGLDMLRRIEGPDFAAKVQDVYLLDLLVLLFVEETERLLQRGLLADYVETEDDLAVLRGRLLADRQVLQRFGRIDRLECRFDEASTDIVENQILAAALAVCAPLVRNFTLRRRVQTLRSILDGACTPPAGMSPASVRANLVYQRLNRYYRDAHQLAWLLLEGLGVHDFHQPGVLRCFAFLLDMNALFERFITRWLTQVLGRSGLTVHSQRQDYSILWNPDEGQAYAAIIPDLLVDAGRGRAKLPVDAKYKFYDRKDVANSALYQTFLYGFAYSHADAEQVRALILYPASSSACPIQRVQIRRAGSGRTAGEVSVCGVHIPTALGEAKEGMVGPQSGSLTTVIQRLFEQA